MKKKNTIKKTITNLKRHSGKGKSLMSDYARIDKNEKLVITAMSDNFDLYSETISISNDDCFTAVVPFRKLEKAVKHGLNSIEKNGDTVIIKNDKCTVKIPCDDNNIDQFPTVELPGKNADLDLSLELMNKISVFSISKKGLNDEYKNILINGNEAVATDIHRISVITSNDFFSDREISIPAETVKKLAKSFSKDEYSCYRGVDRIVIRNDAKQAIIRYNVDPAFPRYRKIIDGMNDDVTYTATLIRKDMLEKTKTLTDMNDEKIKKSRLKIENGSGIMETKDDEGITAEVELRGRTNHLEAMECKFNVGLLHDYFKTCETDSVKFQINNDKALTPLILTEETDSHYHYHALMALRY